MSGRGGRPHARIVRRRLDRSMGRAAKFWGKLTIRDATVTHVLAVCLGANASFRRLSMRGKSLCRRPRLPLRADSPYPVHSHNSNPQVLMMQAAENWDRYDAANRLRASKAGRVFI